MQAKICWIIIIFVFSVGSLQAQESIPFDRSAFPDDRKALREAQRNLRKGNRLFNQGTGGYKEALSYFVKAQEFNPDNAELNYKIGVSYFNINEKGKAGAFLEKAYELDPALNKQLLYMLGANYHFQAQFQKAIDFYGKYRDALSPETVEKKGPEISKRIRECQFGQQYYQNPQRVFVEPLSDNINSPYPDYGPVVNADESILFFTSRRIEHKKDDVVDGGEFGFENIYFSKKDDQGNWGAAQRAPSSLNSSTHDAVVGITPDGQQLLLYRAGRGGNIYASDLEGENWKRPERLSRSINSRYHEPSAAYTFDGNTLFFVSDRPGGHGNHDIYTSTRDEKGRWSEPENIGPVVNTPHGETGVFMHPDGKTLFFSSKGHSSMGGYDIFKTQYVNGEWTEPENLGYPINTTGDDVFISLSADGRRAYISSSRKESGGVQDIYMVTFLGAEKPLINTSHDQLIAFRERPVEQGAVEKTIQIETAALTLMKGTVTDAKTEKPVKATIEITNNITNETIATFSSNELTGRYLVTLPAGKNYGISVKAEGYLFYSENVDLTERSRYEEVENDVQLDKIEVGKSIVLRNIFFDTGEASLRDESRSELDQLYDILNNNPGIRVEISGHTDNVGAAQFNKRLSENRARSVVNYLVEKGIDEERLEYAGYGFDKPIASNDTEEGRQKNRRTEFKIISN